MSEGKLQDEIRIALSADGRCVTWRNNTGRAEIHGRWVQFGVGGPGGADLLGALKGSGRLLALEIKTARGAVTDEQERFLNLVRNLGGFAAVVRSVSDAIGAVDRAVAGGDQ